MTLNDLEWLFCVKIWFELGIQWAGVLAFGENCSEICRAIRIHCHRQKCSPARDCIGDIRVMELFNGITEKRKRETSKLYLQFYTHSFHPCCSLMPVENKENTRITMLELGCRQNMTGMETKRARGKCIANALVCQLC